MPRKVLLPLIALGAILLIATGALAGVLLAQDGGSSGGSGDRPDGPGGDGAAYLGVSVASSTNGLVVGAVAAGSPAAEAGIGVGDIIRSIDGRVMRTAAELRSIIEAQQPGDEVSITYERAGRELRARVTLDEASAEAPGGTTPTPAAGATPSGTPGLEILPPEVRERLQRELDAGRLSPQELQQFLRLYQARGENVRVGTVESVNPGIVNGTFILTLQPYGEGENVAVELNDRTSLLRAGTPIQPGNLRDDELVMVISMDGGQTAFGILAFGVFDL